MTRAVTGRDLVIVARCVTSKHRSVAGDHLRILGDPQWFNP